MNRPRNNDYEHDLEYEGDEVPFHKKKMFSSGIRRARVNFVKASSLEPTISRETIDQQRKDKVDFSEFYLQIVMGKNATEPDLVSSQPQIPLSFEASESSVVCNACNITIDKSTDPKAWAKHEASLAHQVSLSHSHPPSALDRSRMGLNYLETYGWDPDSRQGLGAAGQGRQYPLKPAIKKDTQGIGFESKERPINAKIIKSKQMTPKEQKKTEKQEKQKAQRLHQEFFANDDVLRYLANGSL